MDRGKTMSKRQFEQILEKSEKEIKKSMKEIEKADTRFNQKYKKIILAL